MEAKSIEGVVGASSGKNPTNSPQTNVILLFE